VTAYFTFSSQMRQSLHQFRVFNSKTLRYLIRIKRPSSNCAARSLKNYAETFVAPVLMVDQYMKVCSPTCAFSRRDISIRRSG
jgi:hypothetical protein